MNEFLEEKILVSLNKEQKEAVTYFDSPLLISAGAGSGKTRVVTHKIAYLINNKKVRPDNILALTFTNKAAREMKNRVKKLTGIDSKNLWVSTFHAFGLKILNIEKKNKKNIIVVDRTEQKSIISDISEKLKLKIPKTEIKKIINSFSNLKKKGILNLNKDILVNYLNHNYIDLFIHYQKELEKIDAYDFDDLIIKTLKLFKTEKNIREKYKNKFKYILIDEFQDTSPEQYKLIKEIINKGNICVVGDEDQSIYSWRGADMDIFLSFPNDFPDTKIIRLEQNYRSTSIIIDSATEVIERNVKRIGKKLFTNNSGGNPILCYKADSREKEGEFIAQYIVNNKQNQSFFPLGILYRTNSRSRIIEDYLNINNINYKIIGSLSFYDRKEIKDLTSYLKLAYKTNDNASFLRSIKVPRRGIGKKTLQIIKDNALKENISYFLSLKHLFKNNIINNNKITKYIDLIESLKSNLYSQTIDYQINKIIDVISYKQFLKQQEDTFNTKWENVQELLDMAKKYDNSIDMFINTLTLRESTENISEQSKVLLMTIHAAKGLEFNSVILSGLEDGVLPHIFSKESSEQIEEERRLFYVAMTRAKERLVFTCHKYWSDFIYSIPSKFLYYCN